MTTVRLNDERLNKRLRLILSQMAASYRFFDNDKVGFDGVLRPHLDRTRLRIAAQPVVLLVARLGGFVGRRRDDGPDPQTVWLGMQRRHDIAPCWQTFGPGAPEKRSAAGPEGELV